MNTFNKVEGNSGELKDGGLGDLSNQYMRLNRDISTKQSVMQHCLLPEEVNICLRKGGFSSDYSAQLKFLEPILELYRDLLDIEEREAFLKGFSKMWTIVLLDAFSKQVAILNQAIVQKGITQLEPMDIGIISKPPTQDEVDCILSGGAGLN